MKTTLAVAGALVLGAGLGYFLAPSRLPTAVADDAPGATSARLTDQGEKASLRALRARIKELEKQLAAQRAVRPPEPPATTNRAEKAGGGRPFGPPRFGDFRAHMKELEKNDPARYAQITNRMAQFRARHLQRMQDRLDLLATVDTSHMTAAQKKTHDAYQELLARREELMEKMHDENLTDEQRQSLGREFHELNRELRKLGQQERDTLLVQTAQEAGLEGDMVDSLVSTVKDVYEATQTHGGFGGPPPDGPGGPGGPGGSGGGPGGPR